MACHVRYGWFQATKVTSLRQPPTDNLLRWAFSQFQASSSVQICGSIFRKLQTMLWCLEIRYSSPKFLKKFKKNFSAVCGAGSGYLKKYRLTFDILMTI